MNVLQGVLGVAAASALGALAGSAWAQGAADSRDQAQFEQWQRGHATAPFERYLRQQGLAGVAPLYQLLRSASDWQRCGAEPFAVPPEALWPQVKSTLALLKVLSERGVIGPFEVVSAYRAPALNHCAGGSPRSAHSRAFAVDLWLAQPAPGLCRFWQAEGARWRMGLSRYPSGRIHIDTAGYRTWGEDYRQGSSFCKG